MSNTIIVRNISLQIEQHHLHELFSACGACTINELELSPNQQSKQCTVLFQNADEAKASIFLSGVPLGDKLIDVKLQDDNTAQQSSPQSQTTGLGNVNPARQANIQSTTQQSIPHIPVDNTSNNTQIYVGNLSPLVDESILHQYFSSVGPVVSIKMGANDSTPNRYAFIEFQSVSTAELAKQLNGSMLADRPMKIGSAVQQPKTKLNIDVSTTLNDNEKQRAAEAMRKVREAQARIAAKAVASTVPVVPSPTNYAATTATTSYTTQTAAVPSGNRTVPVSTASHSIERTRSPVRDLRSPSPRRSHSRSHRRSYSRSPSRSRSRSPPRDRYRYNDRRRHSPVRDYVRKGRKNAGSKAGMIWDGYIWRPA